MQSGISRKAVMNVAGTFPVSGVRCKEINEKSTAHPIRELGFCQVKAIP